jgi:hypothetical protein
MESSVAQESPDGRGDAAQPLIIERLVLCGVTDSDSQRMVGTRIGNQRTSRFPSLNKLSDQKLEVGVRGLHSHDKGGSALSMYFLRVDALGISKF